MNHKISSRSLKKGLIIASVPAAVIAATLLPLKPVIHQALVGVVLLWLYVAMVFM